MNLIWPKQNWMTVFASLLYQLFASNVNEIGVWSLQGKPLASAWLKETVLKNDLDGQGRIKVDERLRVKGRNNIFAIGDVTDIPEIKQGFLAQQQPEVVVKNLNVTIEGGRE
ncbi:Apoptosis-inducing factor A [Glycine soja]